jgi:cytochrome P450
MQAETVARAVNATAASATPNANATPEAHATPAAGGTQAASPNGDAPPDGEPALDLGSSAMLPPGPSSPAVWQTIATWTRPTAWLTRMGRRHGRRFTTHLLGQPPFVILSDPEEIREVFLAPPDVLHPGEGARIIEGLVGPQSVILLDEAPHLEQRRLLLPAFHGERMDRLEGLMSELAEREIATWPRDEPVRLHPLLQRLTLEIVMRAVFGLEQGTRLDSFRELLTEILKYSESPLSLLPFAQRALAGRWPMRELEELQDEADRRIAEQIDERRRSPGGGPDVLSLLLSATHEDGTPMSAGELRDELVTALVAGHETTASQLAWTLDLLARAPATVGCIWSELTAGDGDAYLTATIQESMRLRPVLPNAEPRMVRKPVQIGGVRYPPGVVLIASAQLVHLDGQIYTDPYAFRPERFLDSPPGTYTWIPFGGGRRRCLGASFAMLEMKIVLRTLLRQFGVMPASSRPAIARRRGITLSPSDGCNVILRARLPREQTAEDALKVAKGRHANR